MSTFFTFSEKLINLYEASKIGIDPTVDKWPLLSSPLPVLAIVLAYLVFIKKIGPKIMENRRPFDLKYVLVAYNALQVILCFYIVTRITTVENSMSWLFSFGCKYNPDRDRALAETVWKGTYLYWIAKLLDLLDTVFFVLRKKSNQITFLHTYHHCIMFTMTFYYLKYRTVENGIFIGLINSLVHVFMYIYYGISALGPQYRKYLWWKKYITRLQLTQFVIVVIYMVASMCLSCQVDKFLTCFFIVNGFIFLYLFGKFYRETYVQRKKSIVNDGNNNLNMTKMKDS